MIFFLQALKTKINLFMNNVEKCPNNVQVQNVLTARFSKYVWPIFNIMHGRVKSHCESRSDP